MFGRGEGSIQWGDKTDHIEWSNFPQRRPDGVYLPDITGVLVHCSSEMNHLAGFLPKMNADYHQDA